MNQKQKKLQQSILSEAHREHALKLATHAFFKVRDRGISEDLVQETFMKTWSYLLKGGKIEIMKAFLYHVLNHLIVDEYRKRKTTSLNTLLEKGFEPSVDDSKHIFSAMDGKEAMLLIQRLPPAYQKVMRMRYVQSLSLKEMSLITGQLKNTIAVQAHRGLIKLKELYNSENNT